MMGVGGGDDDISDAGECDDGVGNELGGDDG